MRARSRGWRDPQIKYRDVDRLSGAANAAIRKLEAKRFLPGTTAAAIRAWSSYAHRPEGLCRSSVHVVGWPVINWVDVYFCRCTVFEARADLNKIMLSLPGEVAHELRRVVNALDEVLLTKARFEPPDSIDLLR
ncbi:hypothetical protein BZB76_2658 [Actinomadura pelletieri DSM 43383]|uniref:Uncharacterized protein n=2 Tax=Actinomadura pelletieri TaxID=111805 RepID=A0A495QUV4_9ACTN|nr:hypothetical protein BZB76_2658 [Actinomadura pelletieri DSM 43383]